MNEVESIKDKEIVQDIVDCLREGSDRDAMLFLFGIYTGLKISDILKLRVRDVRGKERIIVRDKNGKERRLQLNKELRRELKEYVAERKDWEFLFKSRKGHNKAISRQRAYQIFKDAGEKIGAEYIGTETTRKTFGYRLYKQTNNIEMVQRILGHSSPGVTLRYIGATQEYMDEAISKLNFK